MTGTGGLENRLAPGLSGGFFMREYKSTTTAKGVNTSVAEKRDHGAFSYAPPESICTGKITKGFGLLFLQPPGCKSWVG